MGTDIHLYVEKKRPDGAWECIPPPRRDYARWPHDPDREGTDDGWWGPHRCMYTHKCYGPYDGEERGCAGESCRVCLGTGRDLRWYTSRNYDVFAILAGVRNGRGFAGVETGEGFESIAEPRGVPLDASQTVREHHSGDHTPSWLLLSEICAFDWTQKSTHAGVIPLLRRQTNRDDDSFEEWTARGGGCPKGYSGGVFGRSSETVNESQGHFLLHRSDRRRVGVDYYVQVHWTETYAESADSFLAFVDTFLRPLAVAHDDCRDAPDVCHLCPTCQQGYRDVRVVFWFDS